MRGLVPSSQNPYKMWKIDEKGRMVTILEFDQPEPYNMPRQELPLTYWQTGHIDVIRTETIEKGSMSGEEIYPILIETLYSIDLDTLEDWKQAESRVDALKGKIITPGIKTSNLPDQISLVVLDFDGVITDDRVYVNQRGEEMVAAHRGDGMGIAQLKKSGVKVIILSKEKNQVVKARADKLGIPAYHGIDDKEKELKSILKDLKIPGSEVIYLGNDINDLPCFPLVGLAVAVADAHRDVIDQAGLVLKRKGGHGAVRELSELIIDELSKSSQ